VCPACQTTHVSHWFEKNEYPHYKCRACGHGFVSPIPERSVLDAYYRRLSSGYSSGCSWAVEPTHKLALWQELLRNAAGLAPKGPLLDVGCGGGAFLELAARTGWEKLYGIEPSAIAVRMAESRGVGAIEVGPWQQFDGAYRDVSVVSMFDVLEHDPEPFALLQFAHRSLRPGGVLLLSVPHVGGVSLRTFGRSALVVIPPEHLAYYSKSSIAAMLSRASFQLVRSFTCDVYIKEWLRFIPVVGRGESGARAGEAGWNEGRYRTSYKRLTSDRSLRLISAANRLLDAARLGDQLVVVARALG